MTTLSFRLTSSVRLSLGADIVTHSTTKYINGHSDVVGGALVVKDPAVAEKIGFLQNAMGTCAGPQDCFLVLRGAKTLAIRMEEHNRNALDHRALVGKASQGVGGAASGARKPPSA